MPGLFGILAKTGGLRRADLLRLGQRITDAMRSVPWLRTEVWANDIFCGGRVHLGVLDSLAQPSVTSDGRRHVWFDGEYYPTATAGGTTPTAEEAAEMIAGSGRALAQMDGVFNLACFNAEDGVLSLANDRLGFRPLYYMETNDWFAYAGEVKALLAICDKLPDVDEISLRQFFGFDHLLGERTWWKGIQLIPPASVWRVTAHGRTVHQYWTFDEIRRDPHEEADVQAEFARLWSQDVRRRLKPGTIPLLLSGGQDSRLLLAELASQGADLVAVTFGSKASPEIMPARLAAAVAGIPHRVCDLNLDNWWHHREEAIWQTDGQVNAIHLHAAIATDEMHTGNWYSLANIAGDLVFGGSHLTRDTLTAWGNSPADLLKPRYAANPFFGMDEVLLASTEDVKGSLRGPTSDCFHLRQRMRRMTLTGPGCLAAQCEIVFPGVSHALLQLMLGSLSDEERIDHKFYNRFLASRYPRYFANIPWQATGRGLAESATTRLLRDINTRLSKIVAILPNRYPTYFGDIPRQTTGRGLAGSLSTGFSELLRRRFSRSVGTRVKSIPSEQWFVNYPQCLLSSKTREKLLREDLLADTFLGGAARRALSNAKGQALGAQALMAILTFETYLRQVAGMPSFGSTED